MNSTALTSPETEGQPAAQRALPRAEEQPTVSVWPTAGQALGLCRSSSYAAAASGEIPTIRLGGRLVVPTAALRRMLGLD